MRILTQTMMTFIPENVTKCHFADGASMTKVDYHLKNHTALNWRNAISEWKDTQGWRGVSICVCINVLPDALEFFIIIIKVCLVMPLVYSRIMFGFPVTLIYIIMKAFTIWKEHTWDASSSITILSWCRPGKYKSLPHNYTSVACGYNMFLLL